MAKDNKMTIFISITAVVIFIVVIIATSFAYYSSIIKKENEENRTSSITTANISATFTDGAEINIQNMVPGDSFTKTFTLKNTGDTNIRYKIAIQEVENTFNSKSDIVVVVKEGATPIKTTTFPSTTGAISDELIISPNVTKSYSVTITYTNTSTSQINDMGKTISGKIFIEEV